MKDFSFWLEKLFKFFASIQLAIFVLSGIAVMSAIGTIYEAKYDAVYAQKVIYHSPFMYFLLALLCVNLLNVMIDRLPWKAHHAGFILAHIGIIVLVGGSLVTRLFGVDGSMSFDIGEKNRFVVLPETEFSVFSSFGDANYKHLYTSPRDFLLQPPQNNPLVVPLGSQPLKVVDYAHYAVREQKVVESSNQHHGPAVRIQLQNANVNISQWLNRGAAVPFETYDLGPAQIVLAAENAKYETAGGNEIVLRPKPDGTVAYQIFTKSKGGSTKKGTMRVADVIETGWMGLQLRLLKYLPRAEQKIEYTRRERPSGITTSAILVEFGEQKHWVGLNSTIRLFDDMTMYLVTYRNRLLDIGFDMKLEKFSVGRYQGTNRAMSYESVVQVPELGDRKISMNEPLKHAGYTFYQASFQEDRSGEATTSILSVNKDPGRALKYIGSFLIVLGTIVMFYFKRYRFKIFKKSEPEEGVAK